jgi:hypothetical protein
VDGGDLVAQIADQDSVELADFAGQFSGLDCNQLGY